jgi:hypothetical protein
MTTICSAYGNHNPILSSFMTYHRVSTDPFLVHDLSPGFYRPFSRSWLITGFLPTPFSFMTYHRVSTDPFLVHDLSPGFYRPFSRSWLITGFLPTPFSFMTYHRVSTDPFLVLDLSPGFYRPFPRSWFMTGFLTRVIRRMPLVVGELLNLISSDSPLFWGVRGAVVLLLLAILFYVILRFLTSYCPFVS